MVLGFFLLATMKVGSSTGDIYRNVIIVGFGTGSLMPIITIVVQNALPYRYLGIATSSVQFFRSIGQTIGVAIFGSIVTTRLFAEIPQRLTPDLTASLSPSALALVRNPRTWLDPILPPDLTRELAGITVNGQSLLVAVPQALRGAFASALQDVFLIGGGLSILVILAVLSLREVPLRRSNLEGVLATSHGEGFIPEPVLESGD